MFFRLKKSPSGQCLQLLESYRDPKGEPRHRVVVSLGDAPISEADRPLIARLVDPGSELALLDWLPDSSLPELLKMEIGPAGKDRWDQRPAL